MPINFDGDNLVVTLNSGQINVDVFEDVYESWKDWLLFDRQNMRYIQLFRTVGGDSLTSIISAGAYAFFNNVGGWRLRPPEENIAIFLTGNFAVEDASIPVLIPTIGAFTTAIFGIQPVTQGVTPAMASQLAFTAYLGEVNVNVLTGFTGTGSVGLDEIGTRRIPSNNMTDALAIAVREGLTTFNIASNVTISVADNFSAGYNFVGSSLFNQLTLTGPENVANCNFTNLTLVGPVDGVNKISECKIEGITGFNGDMFHCDLEDAIGITGKCDIVSCFSGVPGNNAPRLTGIGAFDLLVRDMHGSLSLAGVTGGTHSIEIYGGKLTLEATCTGGSIHVRGDPYEITDLSGGAVTLVDQTGSLKLDAIYTRTGLNKAKPLTNKLDGGITAIGINIVATDAGGGAILQTRQ